MASPPTRLFRRWLALVYLPLTLLTIGLLLLIAGTLPTAAVPLLVLLGGWGVIACRLMVERRRRRLPIPLPKGPAAAAAVVAAVGATGVLLAWNGARRLTSPGGLGLVLIGGFLALAAVIAPAAKVTELAVRLAGDRWARRRRPRDRRAGRALP